MKAGKAGTNKEDVNAFTDTLILPQLRTLNLRVTFGTEQTLNCCLK